MWVFWLGLNLYLAQPEQESKINFACIFLLLCFQGQPGVMGMEGQPGLPGYSVSSSVFYHSTFSWAFYQLQIIAIIYSIYRRSVLRKVGWSCRISVWTGAGSGCWTGAAMFVFVCEGTHTHSHLPQVTGWFLTRGQRLGEPLHGDLCLPKTDPNEMLTAQLFY